MRTAAVYAAAAGGARGYARLPTEDLIAACIPSRYSYERLCQDHAEEQ